MSVTSKNIMRTLGGLFVDIVFFFNPRKFPTKVLNSLNPNNRNKFIFNVPFLKIKLEAIVFEIKIVLKFCFVGRSSHILSIQLHLSFATYPKAGENNLLSCLKAKNKF